MKISQKGIDIVKNFERLYLSAYLCPAKIPTIGYGHTLNVKLGDKITPQIAEGLLKFDLERFEREVTALGLKLNQNQFDAVVSFCFNCGTDTFVHSSMYKLLKANPNDTAIGIVWNRYVYAKGVKLNGLVTRRKTEVDLYYSNSQ